MMFSIEAEVTWSNAGFQLSPEDVENSMYVIEYFIDNI